MLDEAGGMVTRFHHAADWGHLRQTPRPSVRPGGAASWQFELGSLVHARVASGWCSPTPPTSSSDAPPARRLRRRGHGRRQAAGAGVSAVIRPAPIRSRDLGDFTARAPCCATPRASAFARGAGPFRSLARIGVEPRPYQLVPLLMALRQKTVRLLIADDVGIGKTIEACVIARELLDRARDRAYRGALPAAPGRAVAARARASSSTSTR